MNSYHRKILSSNIRNGRLLKYLLREWKGRVTEVPKKTKWLFIVGCYNSGTTLLHDLLAKSPHISSMPGEGQFLTNQFLVPSHVGLSRMWVEKMDDFYLKANSDEPDAEKVKKQWISYMNSSSRDLLMEKSPTDIARINWYEDKFEHPFFLGIVRNGYAVAEGIRRKANYTIAEAARQWKVSNEIMIEDLEKTRSNLLLTYEELANSNTETMDRIFNFLDIETAATSKEEVLEIHGVKSEIKNMNYKSFSNLSNSDIQEIEAEAGSLLKYFKYTTDTH